MSFELSYLDSVRTIDDGLWGNSSPFLSSAFWRALEDSGAVSEQTGWRAQHVLLTQEGVEKACLPLFVKNHHRGEYVFDHGWADAYARSGMDYYPRLVSSTPFTPVAGPRVWLAPDVSLAQVLPALSLGVSQLAQQLHASSWHGLFLDDASVATLKMTDETMGLAMRTGCQFMWQNAGHVTFDDFLALLTAKRRKVIRAERRKISDQNIHCAFIEGADLTASDWAFFYACYARTYQVRGQTPYLSLAFFEQLGREMPEALVLCVATHASGERLASALFFKDAHTLYGRYWGALFDVDCLHFEVCYYQGIDYAIAHQLTYFDPGTQGEHKLIRGFSPQYTQSVHWLMEPEFMRAVQQFVAREQVGVAQYYEQALASVPYKKASAAD